MAEHENFSHSPTGAPLSKYPVSQRFHPAARMSEVAPFRVMSVLERAKVLEAQGRSIIHLEVGEPDFSTAHPIIEAGRKALAKGLTAYTPAAGLPALRERIAQAYETQHHVRVSPEQIFITPGASGALSMLAQLLVNPGDTVMMSDPGYPCNRHFVRLAGGSAALVPVGPESRYQVTPALLSAHAPTEVRGVWVATPNNPTGTVLTPSELSALSAWCEARDAHLLVDEIYHGLDYTDGLCTALKACNAPIVVNSFSKYYGMTGWRLGWCVVPEPLIEATHILAQNLYISASTIAQHAALKAFDPDTIAILEGRRQAFRERRDYLTEALKSMGFSIAVPTLGAFYVYAGIERFSDDCEHLCRVLLEEFGVAVTPGTDFGDHDNTRHVRFAFTTGMSELEEAVQRLQLAVNSGKLQQ